MYPFPPSTDATSLASFLGGARSYLAASLVPEVALAGLRQLTSQLPLSVSSDFGFERVLGKAGDSIDFCLGVDRESLGAAILARRPGSVSLPAAWYGHAVWEVVKAAAGRIAEGGGANSDTVDGLFLEFDSATHTSMIPVPSLYLTLGKHAGLNVAVLANDLFPLLAPGGPGNGFLERVAECIEAIPAPGRVVYVGFMHGRAAARPRLSILLPAMDDVLCLLERLRWGGVSEHADCPVMACAAEIHDHFCVTLEFGDRLRPRIGVECFFRGHRQSDREPRWSPFLNVLVEQALCSEGERDALLAFRGAKLWRHPSPTMVLPAINHVKIVLEPGAPPLVKAYFGFRLRDPR